MEPIPQEPTRIKPAVNASDRIVISGVAGLYPQSRNVKEFSEILYNKTNPVNKQKDRWNDDHPEIAPYLGALPLSDLTKFDAQFFKVSYYQGNVMDAMSRKILEQAYQAIYDAGVNPDLLSGKKIGVYVGVCFSETEKTCCYDPAIKTGLGLSGSSKAMFANRVSYWLNAKGPSMAINEGCCSSTCALKLAYDAMTRGDCEMAIVAGSNLCLHPQTSVLYERVLSTCPDGKTKSFDTNADGCAKSEAINVVFLQKAKDALRVYAELVNVKCEFTDLCSDETGPIYGFYRSPEKMANFIKGFYDEVNVSPKAVEYVEAVGSAIPEADKAELEAISEFFCKDRIDPLLVGSVMSNIGYTEAASGLSALTKVILAYETGKIAANLHCESPRQDVPLREGKIRLVTDHTDFGRSYTAINGLSITGVNSHVLLNGCYKPKVPSRYKSNIPYLVTLSGRQESAVAKIINDLKSRPIDPEELALLHNIHEAKISGHLGRGYVILDTDETNTTISLFEKMEYYGDAKRPLWFVYSGMGSQWSRMGKQLLRIPAFAAAIEKCKRVLEPQGIDIIDLICSDDKAIFDNIQNSFVGIAAMQIGLTDVLNELGIKPDKIIGHSVGELGCAYADGCFTVEEMILAASCRGQVSLETPLIYGAMAAVGLGYRQIVKMCPPEIEVACHNSSKSCTISGPAEIIHEFVKVLVNKGIFAKEVPVSNIAYHSRYIAKAGPSLLEMLRKVIKSPKPRSHRWVSTSVPMNRWDEPLAKYSSAEYHTNNFLSPVLFEETSRLIPPKAVLIEIAPHGLLQAILKRSFPSCYHVPLTHKRYSNAVQFFLQAVGELYMDGFYPKIRALYPKIEFPVSTGTRPLSHLVEWVHQEKWTLPLYESACKRIAAATKFIISTYDDDHAYLKGHVIRDKILYPFSGALVGAWDTLAMVLGVEKKQLSVQFTDIHFFTQPILHKQRNLRLNITLHRGNGRFEVLNESTKIVTGYIIGVIKKDNDKRDKLNLNCKEEMKLTSDDIYKLFSIRDCYYSGAFRSIYNASLSLSEANIKWEDNWVAMIDSMLQLNALRRIHETVSQPRFVRKIIIDVNEHFDEMYEIDGIKVTPARIFDVHDYTRCGGIIMHNIRFHDLPTICKNVGMKALKFVPHLSANIIDGEWGGEYYLPAKEILNKEGPGLELNIRQLGDLDSLHWTEVPESRGAGINVKVHFAGVNVVEVQKKMGVISCNKEVMQLFDFSGTTDSGARVMGIANYESIRTHVSVKPEYLWPVPVHWTMEDAATVPLAYCLALYCLGIKVKLQPGITILVHGGAGALGQAVISIALAYGCQVFTTVSDIKKKKFLQKLFPELKESHIGNSRDISFGDMVLHATKGDGVDLIISCVKDALKDTTIKCCRLSGTVIDTTLLLTKENYDLSMKYLAKGISYSTMNLLSMLGDEKEDIQAQKLQLMLTEGIARGYVRPLSRVTYSPQDVTRAYSLQAGSRHRGRVLLDLQKDISYVQTKITCSTQLRQLVISENELLALTLVDRLVNRGARKITLVSLTGSSNCLSQMLRTWAKQGVQIQVIPGNMFSSNNIINLPPEDKSFAGIEGIYYIVSANAISKNNSEMLEQIKLISQRLCSNLKYFAIINDGKDDFERTVLSKVGNQLLTCIKLPALKMAHEMNKNEYDGAISAVNAIDAIEKAICLKQRAILIHSLKKSHAVSLVHELSSKAGVNIPDDIPESTIIADLDIEPYKLEIFRSYLHNMYHIFLDEISLPVLTIKSLRQLEDKITEKEYKETEGLDTFWSNIDNDELLATTEIVFLPTLINSSSMLEDEFDVCNVNQTYLYVVPGVEGLHSRFKILCERLKLGALVLEPGLFRPNETIQEMADRFVKILLKKAQLKNRFYLLGYESGVMVALEMAAILEDQGTTGTVFCIGGAPNEVQAVIEEKLEDYNTEEELQNAVIRHMCGLITKENILDLDRALQKSSTWEEKLSLAGHILYGQVMHSNEYTKELINAAYARIVQARRYNAEPRQLQSLLISIRPLSTRDQHLNNNLPSLQNHSLRKVVEYQLESPFTYSAYDLRCSAIVNHHLDEDILEAFDKRNLCESYITDTNSIYHLK